MSKKVTRRLIRGKKTTVKKHRKGGKENPLSRNMSNSSLREAAYIPEDVEWDDEPVPPLVFPPAAIEAATQEMLRQQRERQPLPRQQGGVTLEYILNAPKTKLDELLSPKEEQEVLLHKLKEPGLKLTAPYRQKLEMEGDRKWEEAKEFLKVIEENPTAKRLQEKKVDAEYQENMFRPGGEFDNALRNTAPRLPRHVPTLPSPIEGEELVPSGGRKKRTAKKHRKGGRDLRPHEQRRRQQRQQRQQEDERLRREQQLVAQHQREQLLQNQQNIADFVRRRRPRLIVDDVEPARLPQPRSLSTPPPTDVDDDNISFRPISPTYPPPPSPTPRSPSTSPSPQPRSPSTLPLPSPRPQRQVSTTPPPSPPASRGGRKKTTNKKHRKGRKKTISRKKHKGGNRTVYGTGYGQNCNEPNQSIYNTNMLKLFPYNVSPFKHPLPSY